jgi:hypothetical protein
VRHGIVDEPRDGRRTIVLISPVLEAAFSAEDGAELWSLDRGGKELLDTPIRLPGDWSLVAVERSDDEARLEAETDGMTLDVRLSDDRLVVTLRVT